MNRKQIVYLSIIFLMTLFIAACSDGGDDATATIPATEVAAETSEAVMTEAEATEVPTTEVAATDADETEPTAEAPEEDEDETEEAAETEDATSTQEVAPVNVIPNVSEDGAYLFNVLDVLYNYSEDSLPDTPENRQWALVELSFQNVSGPDFTIEADDLSVLDADGNRYVVEDWESATLPMVVGAEIPTEEPLRGFALFAVPTSVEITRVEWFPPGSDAPLISEDIPSGGGQ